MKKILVLMSFILFLVGCEQMPTKDTKFRAEKVSRMDVKWVDAYAKEVGVENKYYYKQLTDKEKRAYLAIYSAAQEYYDDITVVDLTKESMERVREALFLDNLDVWSMGAVDVAAYSDNRYRISNLFSGTDKDSAKTQTEQVNKFLDDVVKSIPEGSTYDKVKYVYEYVINYLEADDANKQIYSKNVVNAVLDKKARSTGYTKLFSAILERAGIESIVVSGRLNRPDTTGPKGRVWGMVNVEGEYYYVDTAGGDTDEGVDYGYLLTDKKFSERYYQPDFLKEEPTEFEDFKLPELSDKSLNYYVANGLYFEEYDAEEIAKVLSARFKSGETKVAFQLSYKYTGSTFKQQFDGIIDVLANKYGLYGYWRGNKGNSTQVIFLWRE